MPTLVVLHYTAMQTAEAALERLCDPVAQVSAHHVISEIGVIWTLVPEDRRAWHAGAGQWGRIDDVNSHSIGIELANTGRAPFAEPQMAALEDLLASILTKWKIRPEQVIGHADMALGRKADPGRRFDWRRLALQGLSIWPEARREGEFSADARRFGYVAPQGGDDILLDAFRDRFRPGAQGPLCAQDRALMADLAARWPAR